MSTSPWWMRCVRSVCPWKPFGVDSSRDISYRQIWRTKVVKSGVQSFALSAHNSSCAMLLKVFFGFGIVCEQFFASTKPNFWFYRWWCQLICALLPHFQVPVDFLKACSIVLWKIPTHLNIRCPNSLIVVQQAKPSEYGSGVLFASSNELRGQVA